MALNRRQFLQGAAAAIAWAGRTQRARAGERARVAVLICLWYFASHTAEDDLLRPGPWPDDEVMAWRWIGNVPGE